ncbi:MAG: branched-chain amino acid transport system ATP-binding protein [Thermodesulfobacteriota bacterium]|nr:branched-chain amino acid transport system ATP-binding protein [Thermodesulfobacteriota bacterium]
MLVQKRAQLSNKALLESRGLTKSFGDFTAVENVDYSVTEGASAGIIGPNGAGKSTFFNLLTGMFPPTRGTICFMGKDITGHTADHRVSLGLIRTFQLVSVFNSLSVLDNLVLASVHASGEFKRQFSFMLGSAHRKRILKTCEESLVRVGLEQKIWSLTSELSYGEKRMLEIAMALSLKPKALLLDEPLAGLSEVEIHDVLALINGLRGHLTLVIIEHKISRLVGLVERLSVMHQGRIIADGVPDEVLCDPTVRRVYWGGSDQTCTL